MKGGVGMRSVYGWVVGAVAGLAAMGCAASGGDLGTGAEELRLACGGFVGTACPSGYECVDDTRDSCDPAAGGADCQGVCRRARRSRCDYNEPGRTYVGTSVEECSVIRFYCEPGSTYFANDCGCGCEQAPGETCGAVTCGAGQVCCNASCGICTEPGGFCTQQFCEGI
jgi:hypothetical protein